tara:strand:- start:352 stop:717 length:366 start_codon:yes stop_codon:yes gene_type:complete
MTKSSPKTFVLATTYLEELLQECKEQISISKDLISDFIDDDRFPKSDSYLLPVAEILFCNLTIAYFIESQIDLSTSIENEETGEREILLSEETITLLQSMALSRYYANLSLNKFSYSVSLH